MQKNNSYYFLLVFIILTITSCVQKKQSKVLVLKVTTANEKNIDSIGVRGNWKPLSWRKDFTLTPIVKDSLYTATFTIETGYKFIEIKFSKNGELELANETNRRVYFSETDTTFYNATYNVAP
ncbi:MAG: hypothetical protein ACOVNY_11825 [Chitinophagaceae bacterium]